MERKTLILSAKDVEKCVDLDEVFAVAEEVFKKTGEGQVVLPPKLIMNIPSEGHADYIIAGPASVLPMRATGLKIITGFKHNPLKHKLPYIISTMILSEHETGYPLAIMDGTHLTNARTGAMAAVAAKYLARKDAKSLTVIGAGTQARSVAKALPRVFPLEEIRVFDTDQKAARIYKEEMSSVLKISIRQFSAARDAVEEADIIVTVTSSEGSFVLNEWVKPGSFIASVGTYQELDPVLPQTADKLVVDDKNQARYRGELSKGYQQGSIKDAMVYAELGEIVSGKKAGRESKDERNIACLTGIGTLDVAVAKIIYEKALQNKLGTFFEFF